MKIIAKIDKRTGKLTLSTEGFSGEACLEATRKLREGLRMEAEPERTPEYFQEEHVQEQQQQGSQ